MSSEVDQVVDEILANHDAGFDPEGRELLLKLIESFDKRFGFTPSRREFLAFMGDADAIAAQHTKALDE